MSFLFAADEWLLVGGALVLFGTLAVVIRLIVEWRVSPDSHVRGLSIAGPLTPALAALFSVLVAFTVATEAGYLRSAQADASAEASDASVLAWAATAPGLDAAAIHQALTAYLRVDVVGGWGDTFQTDPTSGPSVRVLRRLETVVREQAATPGLASSSSAELLTRLDALTAARRQRIAEASRQIPLGYLLVLVIAGAALIANVTFLTLTASRRGLLLVVGSVVVVATSLSLLVAVSAPFDGSLTIDHHAIDRVLSDLSTGIFRPFR
ncbi:MAG: hypothetical protein WCI50_01085 [Actinomycetes bacterium]